MKVVIPQITWHSRDPVLSVDFDPSCQGQEGYYRIASGGGDCQLLIWRLSALESYKPEFNCVAELKRHEKPINVVRFNPNGGYIATGGDDSYVIIWKLEENSGAEEKWVFEKNLRKHVEDVTDLSWSPDGNFLVSGSIDNSAVLWDVKKGQFLHQWSEKEHTGFVHGVSYDPMQEFVATMCIDRHLRFFDIKSKKCAHKALKFPDPWVSTEIKTEEKENALPTTAQPVAPIAENPDVENTTGENPANPVAAVNKRSKAPPTDRLFQDEFLPTFCRRLCFSPHGELLLVPGGMIPRNSQVEVALSTEEPLVPDSKVQKRKKKSLGGEKATSNNNAVAVFCRYSWTNPCALIPTLTSYSIASRFCPVYFERTRQPFNYEESFQNPTKNERSFACSGKLAMPKTDTASLMNMPYRLVYAVATNDSILIGDTASAEPLAVIRSIHLARITDISWASNGRALMASSTDGYCSIITFEDGEFGKPYENQQALPKLTKDCFPILAPEPKPEKVKKEKKTPKPKAQKTPKIRVEAEAKKVVGVEEGKSTSDKKKAVTSIVKLLNKVKGKEQKVSPVVAVDETVTVTKTLDSGISEIGQSSVESTETLVTLSTEMETTPKVKPVQKTTLHRWFKTTPKTEAENKSEALAISTAAVVRKEKTNLNGPEVITIDDDMDISSSAVPVTKVYPMTPPICTVSGSTGRKRPSSSTSSKSSLNTTPKTLIGVFQSGVSPEEVYRLTTAPIKCRQLMEESQEVILQSSQESSGSSQEEKKLDTKQDQEKDEIATTGSNSPVSSSSNKTPRRIQLITLNKSGTNGNLD